MTSREPVGAMSNEPDVQCTEHRATTAKAHSCLLLTALKLRFHSRVLRKAAAGFGADSSLDRLAIEVHLDTLDGAVLHARPLRACLAAVDASLAPNAAYGDRVAGTLRSLLGWVGGQLPT